MSHTASEALLWALAAYGGAGLVLAPFFVARGAARIDPGARAGSWGFRLAIVPGVVALWPVLVRRWHVAGTRAGAP